MFTMSPVYTEGGLAPANVAHFRTFQNSLRRTRGGRYNLTAAGVLAYVKKVEKREAPRCAPLRHW
jgi:hypothetical protein